MFGKIKQHAHYGDHKAAYHVPSIISLHYGLTQTKGKRERVCISAKVNNSPKLHPIPNNLKLAANLGCWIPLRSQVLPCVGLLVEMGEPEFEQRQNVEKSVMAW